MCFPHVFAPKLVLKPRASEQNRGIAESPPLSALIEGPRVILNGSWAFAFLECFQSFPFVAVFVAFCGGGIL